MKEHNIYLESDVFLLLSHLHLGILCSSTLAIFWALHFSFAAVWNCFITQFAHLT